MVHGRVTIALCQLICRRTSGARWAAVGLQGFPRSLELRTPHEPYRNTKDPDFQSHQKGPAQGEQQKWQRKNENQTSPWLQPLTIITLGVPKQTQKTSSKDGIQQTSLCQASWFNMVQAFVGQTCFNSPFVR